MPTVGWHIEVEFDEDDKSTKAARALSDLTHQLLEKAATEISAVTHEPAGVEV